MAIKRQARRRVLVLLLQVALRATSSGWTVLAIRLWSSSDGVRRQVAVRPRIASQCRVILIRGGADFVNDDDDGNKYENARIAPDHASGDSNPSGHDGHIHRHSQEGNKSWQEGFPRQHYGTDPDLPPHDLYGQQRQPDTSHPPLLPATAGDDTLVHQYGDLYPHHQQQQSDPYDDPMTHSSDPTFPPPPPFSSANTHQPHKQTLTVLNALNPMLQAKELTHNFNKELIFKELKKMYRKKILPLELSSKYSHFHSPPLSPSDFDAKPMLLLLGQYSVGKTSFIKYLLGRDFPGMRIGPEPTTDRFTAIMHGDSGTDKLVPGAALCSQADKPFRGLSPFGNNFLSRFEGVLLSSSPILSNITLIDTPGILSGQKQSIGGRNYDYESVMKWFAERADLIIIMFDAHKLDISDELKRVIDLLKPHQDKVRVVLNKADSISTQQLMRVYGALMWSLGKVMLSPEVCRVYIGSFWAAPLQITDQAALLNQEKMDLFSDIAQLSQNAVMRRINELVKRARSVKVHAYIIHYLRKQLPYTWGKREKQRRLIDRLDREFVMCARRYELPRGDFPTLEPFRQALLEIKDLSEFPKLDKRLVKEMDRVFSVDIPDLLEKARNQ